MSLQFNLGSLVGMSIVNGLLAAGIMTFSIIEWDKRVR